MSTAAVPRDQLEYKVTALSPVGSYHGLCYLLLSKEDISIFDSRRALIGKWPYNCIRQFREEKDVFAFTSGRRGPFGVNEYQFQMAPGRLAQLKHIVSDLTGAKFQQSQDLIVCSDEILPYHHQQGSSSARTARRSSSSKSDKGTPSPKLRSRSSSRPKIERGSPPSSSPPQDNSPPVKLRANSVQVGATTLRSMFLPSRQMSFPEVGINQIALTTSTSSGSFQSDLRAALADHRAPAEGSQHGYINGHNVASIHALKTSPQLGRWNSRGSDTSPNVSPPRDPPPRHGQGVAPPPPVSKKPTGAVPRRFVPTGERVGLNGGRLRKAQSMGSLFEAGEDASVADSMMSEMLFAEDVVFGSTKDQHHFGSRVSPRHSPSPGPHSPVPLDDYVLMSNTPGQPLVSKPIPAPRRRAATVNKTSYENQEIVNLHQNGLLRMKLKTGSTSTAPNPALNRLTSVDHSSTALPPRDLFDGHLSPDIALDDYEQMSSVCKLAGGEDYVTMKSCPPPEDYEMMQAHMVGRSKITQHLTEAPLPHIPRLQKSSSAHNLLTDLVYDTPRNTGGHLQYPMARSGYDHLESPGLKNAAVKPKRSALLKRDEENPFKGQPKKHVVTAC